MSICRLSHDAGTRPAVVYPLIRMMPAVSLANDGVYALVKPSTDKASKPSEQPSASVPRPPVPNMAPAPVAAFPVKVPCAVYFLTPTRFSPDTLQSVAAWLPIVTPDILCAHRPYRLQRVDELPAITIPVGRIVLPVETTTA